MPTIELERALQNYSINFDGRVLLTDLLGDYWPITFEEVNKIIAEHIKEEENKGAKFEKRFLVQGEDEENGGFMFTIAEGEKKLKLWLSKLKNADHSLYSVETKGNARAPAQILKPIKAFMLELDNIEERKCKLPRPSENVPATVVQKNSEVKKTGLAGAFAKQSSKTNTKDSEKPSGSHGNSSVNKTPIKAEKTSPPGEKSTKGANNNKGLADFFSAAAKTDHKTSTKSTKTNSAVPSKKMEGFFQKQSGKGAKPVSPVQDVKKEVNTSVQIFEDEKEEAVSSSDEEERLQALKREIVPSDGEDAADANAGSSKRRRIEDSEDEDESQQQKQVKTATAETEVKASSASETFLDEDGFVITVKSKKTNKPTKASPPDSKPATESNKKPLATKTPEKPKGKGRAPPSATKGKQSNITSFFNRK